MAEKSSNIGDLIGVNNNVSDTTIVNGLKISSIIGGCLLVVFCILQRTSVLYRYRLVAKSVRIKPPHLESNGLRSLIDWAVKAVTVTDIELVQSAGLDALVMVKLCALGVQIFLPMCIVGVGIFIPMHWFGGESRKIDVYHSTFMKLTMSNYPVGSKFFWVHFVFIYIYMGWSMLLLRWHYHQYLTIRQHYVRKGDDVNKWRSLFEDHSKRWDTDSVVIPTFLRAVPLLKALLPTGLQTDTTTPGADAAKDSDADEDELDEIPLHGPIPRTGVSLPPGVLKTSASFRAHSDIRRRYASQVQPHVQWTRLQSAVDRFGPAKGSFTAANGQQDVPVSGGAANGLARKSLPSLPSDGYSNGMGPVPMNGASQPGGADSTLAGGAGPELPRASNGGPEGTVASGGQLRHPANLASLDSHEPVPAAPNGRQQQQQQQSAGTRTTAPHVGKDAAGPLAEATEAPPGADADPTCAAVASAYATDVARLAPQLSAATGSTSTTQSYHRMQTPFAQLSQVQLQMATSQAGGDPLAAPNGAGTGATPNGGAAAQTQQQQGQDGDVEAGPLPRLDSVETVASPPAATSTMTRCDSMDADAHRLEWWADFGRLRYGGVDEATHSQASRGPGLQWDKDAISLSRPSVSHRKTVNTVNWRGNPVAVLAQHYTVLVTDVVEPRQEASDQEAREKIKSRTGITTVQAGTRRLVNMLPICVRRWCTLGYGHQAASKLDTLSVASSVPSDMPMEHPSARLSSIAARSTGARSRPSYNYQLTPKASVSVHSEVPRLTGPVRARPGHRRTFSTGDTTLPPVLTGAQVTVRQLSTYAPAPGAGGALGPAASEPVALTTAGGLRTEPPVTGPRVSQSRPGPGFSAGRGHSFMHLLEKLAEHARESQEIQAGSSSKSMGPAAGGTPLAGAVSEPPTQAPVTTGRLSAAAPAAAAASQQQHSKRKSLTSFFSGAHNGDGRAAGTRDVVLPDEEGQALGGADGLPLPITAIAMGPSPPASRRSTRRHSGPGPVAEANEVQEAEPNSARDTRVSADGAYSLPAMNGPRASDTGAGAAGAASTGDDRPSAETTASGAAASCARCKWDLVREAVWDGRVARLPYKSGYSVVSSTFLKLFPDEFDRAIPVINYKEVDMLLMQVDQHMAKYEYARKYEAVTGKELYERTGFCGLFGERRRVRDFHLAEINRLMEEVRQARLRAFDSRATSSWFVFFRTQQAAAVATQCVIHAEDNRKFRVHPAPGPEEVNWSALWSNFASRDLRRNMMRPLLALVIIFPIGIFTGALMQLDYLLCPEHTCVRLEEGSQAWLDAGCTGSIRAKQETQVSWDWYCQQHNFIAKLLKQLVIGWLPSLLVTLWQGMILPLTFTFIVQTARSSRSLSEADRAIAKNMFYFAIFNVFLGGVVGSTIIQGINSAIEKGPSEIFNLIGTYVPTSSNFFINYTMFRTLVSLPLRMLWPHIGVRMYLIRRFLRFSCVITQRDKAFLLAPVSPRYGFEVGMILLIYVIGFAYSVVSPLLLVFAVLFFSVAWLFWRWALLYVYVRKYEGGGTMWPFIFSCVLACLGIFPLFTACVFVTKHAYIQAILILVTVPVILVRFNTYCYYRFQSGIDAMPLEVAARAPMAQVEPWVYMPPPLLPNLPGWNPDWSKCWQGWNMPVVYG